MQQTSDPLKRPQGFKQWRSRASNRWAPSSASVDGHPSAPSRHASNPTLCRSNSTAPTWLNHNSGRNRPLHNKLSTPTSLSAAYESKEGRPTDSILPKSDHFVISSLTRSAEPTASVIPGIHSQVLASVNLPSAGSRAKPPVVTSAPAVASTLDFWPSGARRPSSCHLPTFFDLTTHSSVFNQRDHTAPVGSSATSQPLESPTTEACDLRVDSPAVLNENLVGHSQPASVKAEPSIRDQSRHRSRSRGSAQGNSARTAVMVLNTEPRSSSALKSVKTTTKRLIRTFSPAHQSSTTLSSSSTPNYTSKAFDDISGDLSHTERHPVDLYQSPDLTETHPVRAHQADLAPKRDHKNTHTRWASGSSKFLSGLKKKRGHRMNPNPSDDAHRLVLEVTDRANQILPSDSCLRRTSLNHHAHRSQASTTELTHAGSCRQTTAHPLRSSSITRPGPQSYCLADLSHEARSHTPSSTSQTRGQGFSFRKPRTETITRVDSNSTSTQSKHPGRSSKPGSTDVNEPMRCKSPTLSAARPLKSALGLLQRHERDKATRPTKSLTNLNHAWMDRRSRDLSAHRGISATFDEGPHHRSVSQTNHRPIGHSAHRPISTFDKMDPPQSRDELLTSSHSHHLMVGNHPPIPSASCPPFTHAYHPSEFDHVESQAQYAHTNHSTDSGRLSPTKVALSRLDDIIRGISLSQSTYSLGSSTPGSETANALANSFSPRSKQALAQLPQPQTGPVALTPRVRRTPHGSQTAGLDAAPRGKSDASTPVTLSSEQGGPPSTPKKVLIRPSAWKHISITASEHQHRRNLLEHREKKDQLYSTDVLQDPNLMHMTTMDICPVSPSNDFASGMGEDLQEHWQATVGTYRGQRCDLGLEKFSDPQDDDDDEVLRGLEGSDLYETSPSSLTSFPSSSSSEPLRPEHKASDGSLISSTSTPAMSEPATTTTSSSEGGSHELSLSPAGSELTRTRYPIMPLASPF